MSGLILNSRFQLGNRIGRGSFGDIFLATDLQTSEKVAVKVEKKPARNPQLYYEAQILQQLQGGPGVANLVWYGEEGSYKVMVIELLGQSLEDLFNQCKRKFSLKTVLMIADQLISRLEYLHSRGIIHRDVKPDNFLIGLGKKSSLVHIIDFGLSIKYWNDEEQHIPYKESRSMVGTARYTSINTHLGVQQSRRDDLEAVGYLMVYFFKGDLPWQGSKGENKQQKYAKIMERKMNTPLEILCSGCPPVFPTFINYCRNLEFNQRPDYGYWRRALKELFIQEGFQYDFQYDWCLQQNIFNTPNFRSENALTETPKNTKCVIY